MKGAGPVLVVLNLAVAGAIIAPQPAGAGPPPFGIGDWTVTGNETYENRSFLLDGNLGIGGGGSLTLSNCTLIIYCRTAGEHSLTVGDGGTLRVLNGSDIAALDPWKTFRFVVGAGAHAELSNSTFTACGNRLAGIESGSSDMVVDNCTIIQGFYACTFTAPAAITSTRFAQNYIGIISMADGMVFRDCVFEDNGFSAWVYTSGAEFSDCDFINNSIGIAPYGAECAARNCRFIGNIASAVFCWQDPGIGPSNVTLEDCLFEGNGVGVNHLPDMAGNRLWMTNCDFQNSSRFGIEWYSRVPPAAGNRSFWDVTQDCRVINSRMLLAANITVREGGHLSIAGSNLTMDCVSDGENGVLVRPGGRLDLGEGTVLRAGNGSHPFALRCQAGSSFSMDGALLRDCGWNSSSPESGGPLFEGSDIRMARSTVDFCPVAIALNNSRGAVIEASRIRGLEAGAYMNDSSLELHNSTLASVGGWAACLGNSSFLDCVNSDLARDRLDIQDAASRVNLSWYLDVRSLWANGAPASGANLSVRDLPGAEVVRERLGADGRLAGLVLREVSMGRLEAANFTPHDVNCSVGAVFNATLVNMDQSRAIDIVLEDRQAPNITIARPAPEASLGSGTVLASGTARDNLGVEKVELVVDGFRRLTAYSAGGGGPPAVEWNATLELHEGPHTIEARALDPVGNLASAVVSFTVDWSAPRIRIASPPDGHLTNDSLLAVSGYMEPGSGVLLNGAWVKTERDLFGGTVVLGEGDNLVTATALDRAGNSNSSTIRVRLDTRPPALDVAWPPDGLRTNIPAVPVNGTMEPGAQVTVNGRPVALTGGPGTFRTAVALGRETNSIVVDAVDSAGNHNLTVRTVLLDTRPPGLTVTYPPEGLVTNRTDLLLAGVSEGGALLSVDGNGSEVAGEPGAPAPFLVPLRLSEGPNTVRVTAVDGAGNLNSTARHVVVDTSPPRLSIHFPAEGYATTNGTVFILGETEPDAFLTVGSREVAVGQTGLFSLEVRLTLGFTSFAVSARDEAGNENRTTVVARRLPAASAETIMTVAGVDWPFAGFIVLSLGMAVTEGYFASRRLRKRSGG